MYMRNLKNKTNEQTWDRKSHRHREQTGGCQKRGRLKSTNFKKIQTSSYEVNESWVWNVQCGEDSLIRCNIFYGDRW